MVVYVENDVGDRNVDNNLHGRKKRGGNRSLPPLPSVPICLCVISMGYPVPILLPL